MTFLADVVKQMVLAEFQKSMKLFLQQPWPAHRELMCCRETKGLFQHAVVPKWVRKFNCTGTFPLFFQSRFIVTIWRSKPAFSLIQQLGGPSRELPLPLVAIIRRYWGKDRLHPTLSSTATFFIIIIFLIINDNEFIVMQLLVNIALLNTCYPLNANCSTIETEHFLLHFTSGQKVKNVDCKANLLIECFQNSSPGLVISTQDNWISSVSRGS